MATKSGGGTTGSEKPPYTRQDLTAWKRSEKGRLNRIATLLDKQTDIPRSFGALENAIESSKRKITALDAEVEELKSQSIERDIPLTAAEQAEYNKLEAEEDRAYARDMNRSWANPLSWFPSSDHGHNRQMEILDARNERRTVERRRAKDASRRLKSKLAEIKEANAKLGPLEKFHEQVLSALPASKLVGLPPGSTAIQTYVENRLGELEKDPPPVWVVESVIAYVKAEEAEERRLIKEAPRLAKQLKKDSLELAELGRSQPSRLKQITNLEHRLEREKQRLSAEREFLSKKLTTKGLGAFTKREIEFAGVHEWHGDVYWDEVSVMKWVRNPNGSNWKKRGPEFFPKIRTMTVKIEELTGSVKESRKQEARFRSLKGSVRDLEKKIEVARQAPRTTKGDRWPEGIAPRIGYVANAHAFEKYMAEWMRWLGWEDAKAMPVGPDEGIDVKATGALGQAKHWDTVVGIEEVQRHNGVCEGIQKYGRVFLSKNGYTPQAIKWANDWGLPLFEMKAGDKDAGVVASTKAGEELLNVGAKAMKGNKRN